MKTPVALVMVTAAIVSCSSTADLVDGGAAPPDTSPDTSPDAVAPARPLASCPALALATQPEHPVGPYSLVPGEAYVVYTELRQHDSPFIETANMFLLRGEEDASGVDVWIFGTGYGDAAGLAYFPYPRTAQYASRGAAADVADADGVIQTCLGVPPARARLRVIAPHYHFDHLNAEVIEGLVARGYSVDALTLYVHELDFDAAFCGQPCAGTTTGGGALPAFSDAVRARAVRIGSPSDACGATVMTFTTPALGSWDVRLSPGHTDGGVSLDNRTAGVRLKGASQTCLPAEGLAPIEQHKSIRAWPGSGVARTLLGPATALHPVDATATTGHGCDDE